MTNNLDILLTALSVAVDDRVLPALSRESPAGLQARTRARTWPGCSRARRASLGTESGCGLLAAVITELARDTPSWRGLLRLVDSTPPPTAGTSPPGSGSSPAAASRSRRSFDTLKGQLTLEDHGGRALAGGYARVAARLLALASAIHKLAH